MTDLRLVSDMSSGLCTHIHKHLYTLVCTRRARGIFLTDSDPQKRKSCKHQGRTVVMILQPKVTAAPVAGRLRKDFILEF